VIIAGQRQVPILRDHQVSLAATEKTGRQVIALWIFPNGRKCILLARLNAV
jgi:hypothetical protein